MKKTVLLLALLGCIKIAYAQRPVMFINSPANLVGVGYNIGVGVSGFGPTVDSTLVPVTGNLVLVYDSTATSLPNLTNGCDTISNAAAVAGHIALIDAGTCSPNVKVDNAQAAGAIAVVICSSTNSVLPVFGSPSASTTIPVIMITKPLCDQIKAQLLSDTVNITINGNFHFDNDLQCTKADILALPYAAIPVSEVQYAGDSKIYLGAKPVNIGNLDISGASMNLNIEYLGASIYNESLNLPAVLGTMDSSLVVFNGANQDSAFYPTPYQLGTYTFTYTGLASNDEDSTNNVAQQTLQVTNCTMSKVPLQGGRPICDIGIHNPNPNALYTEVGNLFHIKYGSGYEIRTAYMGLFVPNNVTTLNGKMAVFNIRRWDDINQDGIMDRLTELTDPIAYGEPYLSDNLPIPANRILMTRLEIYDAATNSVGFFPSDDTYYVMTGSVAISDSIEIGASTNINHSLLSTMPNIGNAYYTNLLIEDSTLVENIGGTYYQPSLAFDVCYIPTANCSAMFFVTADSLQNGVYYAYNNNNNPGAYTYLWNFGDGTTSANPYPVHNYAQPGVYNICLTMTNVNGNCTNTYCYNSPSTMSQLNIYNNTGTSQVIATDELYINPNPSLGDLTISIDNNTLASLTVLDLLGHPILTQAMSGSVYQLDISALPAGLYLLRVQATDGKTATRRIVKQ